MSTEEKVLNIIRYAHDFVHLGENWEHYLEMKTSQSASLPVEFMNMAESVEAVYGEPVSCKLCNDN